MTDHCCAHPKCPGGSLCCCQGQPDPIERAAQALPGALATVEQLEHLARAVFASIDTDEIARILHPGYGRPREDLPEGQPCLACKRANIVAQDIKNYLTGGNQ